MNQPILAADLFCGAGGGSTAFIAACEQLGLPFDLLAINHWDKAIETHSANHPHVRHLCENLECVLPTRVVPGRKLHFALFAPECTNHSRAKGGKPKNEQSRATAWHVVRWAEELDIENILVENVEEFLDWGPLYPDDYPEESKRGKPIPEKKGLYYRNWLRELTCRGYKCEHRILNAAYFGAATSRRRYFLQAKKIRGNKRPRITWPEPTHSDKENLFGLPQFRAAREIIDPELEGKSIYDRKKPLADNTMKRIYAGIRKFSGLPFLMGQQSCAAPRGVDDPVPTIATRGAISYLQPFVVIFRNNRDSASLDDPLSTITTSGKHHGLAEPFIVPVTHAGGENRAYSPDSPLPTVTGANRGEMALVETYVIHMEHSTEASGHERRSLSADEPLPTLTTRAAFGVCKPFVVPVTHSKDKPRAHDLDKPLPTITTAKGGEMALCEPYLTKFHGAKREGDERVYSMDEPLKTIDTSNRIGVAAPFLVSFKGQDSAAPLEAPLGTVTGRDRFGLCEPFLVPNFGEAQNQEARTHDLGSPLPTVTSRGAGNLVQPFILPPEGYHRGNAPRDIEIPLQTITAGRGGGNLVEPFFVNYNGKGEAHSVDSPLPTITTRDRFALVEPHLVEELGIEKGDIIGVLDIRFRMLQPHELSAAMGFPTGYIFAGTKEQAVKQIGNAIVVEMATALCLEMLRPYAKKTKTSKAKSKKVVASA